MIDTRASVFYWNFTLRVDGVVMIARESPREEFRDGIRATHERAARRGAARAGRPRHPQLGRTAPRLCKPRAISVAPRVFRESYA